MVAKEGPSTCSFCVVGVFSPPVDASVEGNEERGAVMEVMEIME